MSEPASDPFDDAMAAARRADCCTLAVVQLPNRMEQFVALAWPMKARDAVAWLYEFPPNTQIHWYRVSK